MPVLHHPPALAQGNGFALPKSLRSPLLAMAAAAALAGCGGGGGGETQLTPPITDSGRAEALSASKPGELANWAQDRLRARQSQGNFSMTPGLDWVNVAVTAIPAVGTTITTTSAGAPAADAGVARSTTLVQEAGVDEADLLLSDGSRLFTLQPKDGVALSVKVHNRNAQGVAQQQAEVPITDSGARDLSSNGMYLSADNSSLTVLTQAWFAVAPPPSSPSPTSPTSPAAASTTPAVSPALCVGVNCDSLLPGRPYIASYMRNRVGVHRVSVASGSAPAAGEHISIEGALIDSRRIGDTLYLVTQYSPLLPLFVLPAAATGAERESAIQRTTAADLLPTLRRNGGPAEALLSDTDCYVQTNNASTGITVTTITMVDLKSPTLARSSRCFAGGSEALYMSTNALYLATTRWSYPENSPQLWRYPAEIMTDLHKFALQGGGVVYKGSGAVSGHLGWDTQRKSMRLSEHNGDLRVLTYTGDTGWFTIQDASDPSKRPSPARLTVLRERASDQSLQVLATLPSSTRPANIGKPGEQVYGVRFVGDRGYVVTFRRTDPLYVLDLSNPTDPKTAGELEIAGFSEHLIPLADNLLLGVGRSADNTGRVDGLKVALFDVADATRPSQRGEVKLGGPASQMTLDLSRHGLNFLMKGDVARVAMPVNLVDTNFYSSTYGLQRFEVDTSARTLKSLSMLGSSSGNIYRGVWQDRSLQMGDQVYYLNDGKLGTFNW